MNNNKSDKLAIFGYDKTQYAYYRFQCCCRMVFFKGRCHGDAGMICLRPKRSLVCTQTMFNVVNLPPEQTGNWAGVS